MELETKVLSQQIQEALYNNNKTLGTAESCTGGGIAEAIVAVPGASQYFKGGIVSYTNEIRKRSLAFHTRCWKSKLPCARKWQWKWSREHAMPWA